MAVALQVDREAIRLAAIAGVSYQALARKYGMLRPDGRPDTTVIRQWAKRGQWPIPSRVIESARRTIKMTIKAEHAKVAQSGESVTGHPDSLKNGVTHVTNGFSADKSASEALVTVTDNLQELGQQGTLLASQLALRSLKRAPDSLPVTSMAEAKTAMQIVRIAAGMDSGDGPTINLGLFGGGGSATSGEVIDIGGDEPEQLDDDMFD